MFFEFTQNNSGGYFDVDDNVCHRLLIEADNEADAIQKAENLGCYWDGVDKGIDCQCCGDRWNLFSMEQLSENDFPMIKTVYSYKSAESLFDRYKSFPRMDEPKNKREYGFAVAKMDVRIDNIEMYAQYMSNEWGWTTPDVRIFYKNGDVKEFFKES